MAYDQIDPIGNKRGDLQAAVIAKVIADVNTPKGGTRHKLQDFIPEYGPAEQPEEADAEAIIAFFRAAQERQTHG